jgi:hypothetical protein
MEQVPLGMGFRLTRKANGEGNYEVLEPVRQDQG